eukprot:GFUD01061862.1.p1 GENE.GFUD01061862.1~~GFUD01061862.1.p1  ORF type:complete len:202 (-),score=53.55 GFUD01061862.1:56-571(-)
MEDVKKAPLAQIEDFPKKQKVSFNSPSLSDKLESRDEIPFSKKHHESENCNIYKQRHTFKPKYQSQKTKSKYEQQIQNNSKKRTSLNLKESPEKLSQIKSSLKVVARGGWKVKQGRHHLSCPDLSRWTDIVDSLDMVDSLDIVDSVDMETWDMFEDNHCEADTELIEINIE